MTDSLVDQRERGTIVSWKEGVGRVRDDNGESLRFFYWSVVQGFDKLRVGQRVEFSRGVGLRRNVANLIVAVPAVDAR